MSDLDPQRRIERAKLAHLQQCSSVIWDGVRLHIAVREVLRGDLIVRPGGHDLPQVFSGTLIVLGSALAQVIAIGSVCMFALLKGYRFPRSVIGYAVWAYALVKDPTTSGPLT